MTTAAPGFFFVRHGETTANRDRVRSGGECDVGLTGRGRRQAAAVGLALSDLAPCPGLIVSSALARAHATARIINDRLGLDLRVEPGLNERRLGEWNGRSVEETQPLLAAGVDPPGGESGADFRARVLATFRALAPLYGRWPLIVGSRGISRVLLECTESTGVAGLPNGVLVRVTLADANDFRVAGIDFPANGEGRPRRAPGAGEGSGPAA